MRASYVVHLRDHRLDRGAEEFGIGDLGAEMTMQADELQVRRVGDDGYRTFQFFGKCR